MVSRQLTGILSWVIVLLAEIVNERERMGWSRKCMAQLC